MSEERPPIHADEVDTYTVAKCPHCKISICLELWGSWLYCPLCWQYKLPSHGNPPEDYREEK